MPNRENARTVLIILVISYICPCSSGICTICLVIGGHREDSNRHTGPQIYHMIKGIYVIFYVRGSASSEWYVLIYYSGLIKAVRRQGNDNRASCQCGGTNHTKGPWKPEVDPIETRPDASRSISSCRHSAHTMIWAQTWKQWQFTLCGAHCDCNYMYKSVDIWYVQMETVYE
jgi:hypothetical protein